MANLSSGDGLKLGRSLPNHQLMHSLLSNMSLTRHKPSIHVTRSTQTDLNDLIVREPSRNRLMKNKEVGSICSCCSGGTSYREPKQINKFTVKKYPLQQHNVGRLLESLRQRMGYEEHCETCSCIDSDGWSDSTAGSNKIVVFPKETRNAFNSNHRRRSKVPPPPPPMQAPPLIPTSSKTSDKQQQGWPGMATRLDTSKKHLEEVQIKSSKLSKNKLYKK